MHAPRPARRRTPWLIRLSVLAGFMCFVSTMAVIYYEYVTTPEPDCIILVFGNPKLDQTVVRVEAAAASETAMPEPLSMRLDQSNGYAARFFLTSGTYHLKLTQADGTLVMLANGQAALDTNAFIPGGFRQQYDLGRLFPMDPATKAAER